MSYTYYYLAFLPTEQQVSLVELKTKIEKRFESIDRKLGFHIIDNKLTVEIDGWKFRIFLNEEPYVQEESQEIAKLFAQGKSNQEQIASVRQRFEVYGDADPDMEYFNAHLLILEVIVENYGAILFDPDQGGFI